MNTQIKDAAFYTLRPLIYLIFCFLYIFICLNIPLDRMI